MVTKFRIAGGEIVTAWQHGDTCARGNGTIELSSAVSGESFYTPPGPLSELVAGAIRDVGQRPVR